MQTIDGLDTLTQSLPRSVVAIGKFDGVHRGHQALIRAAVEGAREQAAESVVVTFDRHPVELLKPGTLTHYLTPLEERLRLIDGLGVDHTLLIHLSTEFLNLTAEEFVRSVLVERLGMVAVAASESFRFGRGPAGTVDTLRELGPRHGFRVEPVPPLLVGGSRVSSSRVVDCVLAGRIEEAASLLGRPYTLFGRVVRGDGMGAQLGFPTANIEPDERQHRPGNGVYAGFLAWDDEDPRPAVCNLGVRPTVDGARQRVEAHVLGFSGDLYGRPVRLQFTYRLRDEQRFPNLDALKAQIAADAARAAAVLDTVSRN
jgi:riboflavin kinase / FMN adenylyltransferase